MARMSNENINNKKAAKRNMAHPIEMENARPTEKKRSQKEGIHNMMRKVIHINEMPREYIFKAMHV